MFYEIRGNQEIPIPLDSIKLPDGGWYSDDPKNTDELKLKIDSVYRMVWDKFLGKDEPVVFKTPGIKSGLGKGNLGYSFPRIVDIPTKAGRRRVAWCDTIEEEGGKKKYLPVRFQIGTSQKTMILGTEDIELILAMFLINQDLNTPQNLSGRTFLEDKEAEAEKFEIEESKGAIIHYWLFTKGIGFCSDEPRVNNLCLAWGIPNPQKLTLARKKQLLSEKIKESEKKNELNYNLAAFNEACKKMADGDDIRDIEILSAIQQCMDKKIIAYNDAPDFRWIMLDVSGKMLKTICKVQPPQSPQARTILKNYLINHPDEADEIIDLLGNPDEKAENVVKLYRPLPEVVTKEWLKDDLMGDMNGWVDAKNLFKYFGGNPSLAKKETLIPFLIQKMVDEGKRPPFVIREPKK